MYGRQVGLRSRFETQLGTDCEEQLIKGCARALSRHFQAAEHSLPTVAPKVPHELCASARHTHAGTGALPVEPQLG